MPHKNPCQYFDNRYHPTLYHPKCGGIVMMIMNPLEM